VSSNQDLAVLLGPLQDINCDDFSTLLDCRAP